METVRLRYQGPHTAVDVMGQDRMFLVRRGETVALPTELADNLLRSPDWDVAAAVSMRREPDDLDILTEALGLYLDQRNALSTARLGTFEALAAASDEEILAVPGIGPWALGRIRAALSERATEDEMG